MRTDSSESFLSYMCPHVIVYVCELVKKLNSNIEESLCLYYEHRHNCSVLPYHFKDSVLSFQFTVKILSSYQFAFIMI